MTFDLMIFLAAILAVPIFGLADATRRPPEAFEEAGRSKTVWVVVQIIVPVFGTLAYYAWIRPRVRAQHEFDD